MAFTRMRGASARAEVRVKVHSALLASVYDMKYGVRFHTRWSRMLITLPA